MIFLVTRNGREWSCDKHASTEGWNAQFRLLDLLSWVVHRGQRMAERGPQKVAAILQEYAESLEVLTINSKPLINDLTIAADRYKPLAARIIEMIESRLFEVSTAFLFIFHLFLYAYLLGSCTYCERTANEAVNRDVMFTVESSRTCLWPSRGTCTSVYHHESKKDENIKKRVLEGMWGSKLCDLCSGSCRFPRIKSCPFSICWTP